MNESILPVCINLYEGPDGAETSFQDRIYRADAIAPAITTCFRPWFLLGCQPDKTNNPLGCIKQ